jgi:hypothetical protein
LLGERPEDGMKRVLWNQCKIFCRIYEIRARQLTYLFKDLYNWRQWEYLQQVYQMVDYDQLVEEEDTTRPQEEVSCAGGACVI